VTEICGCLVPARIATVATTATAITTTATAVSAATATAFAAMATATAATAIFVAASAATATAAAFLAGPGFIDAKGASVNLLAVELAHSVLRIAFGSHGHESEPTGLAREFVLHEQHFGYSTGLCKHVLQLELRRRERQVTYVQSISHNGLDFGFRSLPSPQENVAENTPLTAPAKPEVFLCYHWHAE
jgi:hypothetical protein